MQYRSTPIFMLPVGYKVTNYITGTSKMIQAFFEQNKHFVIPKIGPWDISSF